MRVGDRRLSLLDILAYLLLFAVILCMALLPGGYR